MTRINKWIFFVPLSHKISFSDLILCEQTQNLKIYIFLTIIPNTELDLFWGKKCSRTVIIFLSIAAFMSQVTFIKAVAVMWLDINQDS